MSHSPVRLELEPPFARLMLNRPDRKNALDMAMWSAIADLLDTVEHNPEIRIVLLSGVDESAFSAGADISEFFEIVQNGKSNDFADIMLRATRRLGNFPKPVIAVIQGPCIAGGCVLAMCCDFRFADTTARMGVTPAKIGIAYPLEQTKRLIEVVGVRAARDLLMTARIVGSDEALKIGLVDRVVEASALWSEVYAYGRTIAGLSQFAVRASKAMIGEILDGAASETANSRRLFNDAFAGEDLAEGARAFMEKRSPRFTFS